MAFNRVIALKCPLAAETNGRMHFQLYQPRGIARHISTFTFRQTINN
jgi:hypothetical protein